MNSDATLSARHKSFRQKALWVPVLFSVILCTHNPSSFYLIGKANMVEWVSTGAASLLLFGMIFFDFRRCLNAFLSLRKLPLCAIGLLFLIAVTHFLVNDRYAVQHLGQSLLYLTIPVCGLVYYDVFRKSLPVILACVGVYDIFYSIMEVSMKKLFIYGVAGNINWNASLLLTTLPFMLYEAKQLGDLLKLPKWCVYGLQTILGLCAVGFIILEDSRAVYLSMAATGILFLFAHLSPKNRKKLFFALLIAGGIASFLIARFGVDRLSRILSQEDRLIIWDGAVNLFCANIVTGVGGVSFEDAFMSFKPVEYFFAKHVAPRSDHPHNHFLYIGCLYGIFGMLSWMYLVLYPIWISFRKIWNGEEKSFMKKAMIFVLVCGLFHANLDLVFDVFPNMFFFFVMLGMLWKENLCREDVPEIDPSPWLKTAAAFGGSIVFLWGVFAAVRTGWSSQVVRDLMIRKMPNSERAALIRKTVMLCPDETRQNFAMLYLSERVLHYAELSVYITGVMNRSTVSNYASVAGTRGNALARLGRYEEARQAYIQEMTNFPMSLIPVYNLISVSRLMGDIPTAEKYSIVLKERMKVRGIPDEWLPIILKTPSYDLRPWNIPKELGGQGEEYGNPQK